MNDPITADGRQKLIILTGPTAVGKTALSIGLARAIGAEIISADSMQVYRGMDIGTAKITHEEMQGVPHHMIDIIEPDEEFSVLIFKDMAKKCIDEITARGHIPMIVGGTGFYIQAVLYDVDFSEYSDEEQSAVRSRLEAELEEHGPRYMHDRLASFDPASAAIIHPNNIKRMMHAIEFYEITGRPISEHNSEQHERTSPYDFLYIVVNDDRSRIYSNIDRRVDLMMEAGLADEVRALRARGYTQALPSMMGLGYKEIDDWLEGRCTLDKAVEIIKRDTRHFARKQLTWFKREKETFFVDKREHNDPEELLQYVLGVLEEKLSIVTSDKKNLKTPGEGV